MLHHDALQVRHRLISIAARELELREPHQCIGAARGRGIRDDDGSQVALGVGRSRRDHRAPVQRVHVCCRPGRRGVELLPD